MEESKLKTIYKEYFQNKIKQSNRYKELFSKAVDCEKEYLSTIPIENKEKIEQLIDTFISAENQMLEDTFVYAVKYVYELFNEITK